MSHFFEEKRRRSTSSDDDLSQQQPFLNEEPLQRREKRTNPSSSHLMKLLIHFIGTAILVIVATFIIINKIHPSDHVTRATASVNPEQILECGTSAEEARARGCVFDVMHYSWIPEPCFNATLSKQYWEHLISLGIEFWNDTTKTHVLPYEEILAAKHEYVYTSWLLHLKHCQYLLHRQIQSLVYGLPLDNLLRIESHAEHCLEEVRSPGDVKTMLYSGTAYLKCASGVGDIGPIFWNQPPPDMPDHRTL
ncbi:hypothetical protein N431DRAFT_458874 [Stipitochalara longipes BDJ]|nr:hypothetical protein N431DRAFT_458874 [Stipitochalara longipes BDJ]